MIKERGLYLTVDIQIDKFTDCLVERETGIVVDTEYVERVTEIQKKDCFGWKFDWTVTQKKGYTIYELFVEGDDTVQGRISLKIDGGVADIDIVESAPHNYGRNGKYEGIGGHLFAIACQISYEAGCDGFVAFTAKSDLVDYYKRTLKAKIVRGNRMYLDEEAANILIDKYIRK